MNKFDKQYMKMAYVWAENSHAVRHKVGALIVKDNMIISDGYNGMPSGFDNCCEICEPQGGCQKRYMEEFPYSNGCQGELHSVVENGVAKLVCKYSDVCKFAKLTTKPEVLHAEANAITKIAKSTNSSEGATLYVTMSPCIECAKLIIQSGIRRVVYNEKYRIVDGLDLLRKAGIEVEQIEI